MRIKLLIVTMLCAAFGAGVVSAQDDTLERHEPRQSYQACDWGLLIIEQHTNPDATFIDITAPAANSGVPSSFTVSGDAYGIFENQFALFVTSLDATELFHSVAIVDTDEVAGRGTWSVDVELGDIDPATRIVVHAYADSPADGSILAEDVVYLSANSQFGLPYIDIVTPASGDGVSTPLIVEGTAGALFENSFVLEVTDIGGNILDQLPVMFDAPDIGLSGPWSAVLDFATEAPGMPVIIRAYALSMADGEGIVAEDSAQVTVDLMLVHHERILVVQAGDPLTQDDDICAATGAEFDNTAISPVHVTAVTAMQTRSMPPQATLLVDIETPSMCQMPLRLRLTSDGDAYSGDVYYDTANGEGICTRDIRPSVIRVPLGVQPSGVFTATVNGVALATE